MPDSRFFKKSKSFTLNEIAEISGASLHDETQGEYVIDDLGPLHEAGEGILSFFDNAKYKAQFLETKAGACFVSPEAADIAPEGVRLLVSNTPYKAYALTAQAFYPASMPAPSIAQSATVHDSADIAEGCVIGEHVVVGPGAQIGAGTWLEPGCVIEDNVVIGAHCRIGSNATVSHSLIGDYVRLYPGVRVGQDGFGFAIDPAGHVKVPQLGRVIIEDHVEIGANTTIDRGAGPDTVIGQGAWIDNLVQIGHNVKIGKGCVIVAQVGISGSSVIEDFAVIGGQVGIAGHLTVGMGAQIAAQSGVMRDVPAGEKQFGSPAMPFREAMKQIAALNRLIKKGK